MDDSEKATVSRQSRQSDGEWNWGMMLDSTFGKVCFGLGMLTAMILMFMWFIEIGMSASDIRRGLIVVAVVTAFTMAVVAAILIYLTPRVPDKSDRMLHVPEEELLKFVKGEVEIALASRSLSPAEQIVQADSKTIAAATEEASKSGEKDKVDSFSRIVQPLREGLLRLRNETNEQARRGNINLVLGILATVAGVGVLASAVFAPALSDEPSRLAAHFVPRASLALLIELFAFFFLRLYKQSLAEIKYFQNERTNIESKWVALEVALETREPGLLSKVVEELAKSERNFILTKDQTTVELEKERIGKETYLGLADSLKQLVKK